MNIDIILDFIKIVLLLMIVILLSLNYCSFTSGLKYDIYNGGKIHLNKVKGETYMFYHDQTYIKMKIKE